MVSKTCFCDPRDFSDDKFENLPNSSKEDKDPVTQKKSPRKYFSGGYDGKRIEQVAETFLPERQNPEVKRRAEEPVGNVVVVEWVGLEVGPDADLIMA